MKNLFLIVFCFISVNFFAQDLEQDWKVDTILNSETTSLPKLVVSQGFSLNDGKFEFSAVGEDSVASGTYLRQQNLIILHHQRPKEALRYFNIVTLDADRLVV
ncbi:MAG TPA: Na+ dependent nucleoside transporter, partial [Polaribacter sp.]|nr:Na+ dependent nucleoside transporter [Polaribacter sp.]